MAQLNGSFDSGQHDDMNNSFEPIPAGEYMAMVKESDIKTTAKGNGKYIKLKFEIIQGEFKGRFIWTNLNIINPNPVAVEIAQKELATLCRAVGKAVIQDTNQLHGIPFKMKIKIKPAKGDYPAGNEPVGYSPATVMSSADPSEVEGDFGEEPQTTGSESVEENHNDEIPWGE